MHQKIGFRWVPGNRPKPGRQSTGPQGNHRRGKYREPECDFPCSSAVELRRRQSRSPIPFRDRRGKRSGRFHAPRCRRRSSVGRRKSSDGADGHRKASENNRNSRRGPSSDRLSTLAFETMPSSTSSSAICMGPSKSSSGRISSISLNTTPCCPFRESPCDTFSSTQLGGCSTLQEMPSSDSQAGSKEPSEKDLERAWARVSARSSTPESSRRYPPRKRVSASSRSPWTRL